jgi:beta-lactamase class A
MPSNSTQAKERLPIPPAKDSVASAEVSLYRNVLRIKQEHSLLDLGISFYDAETTIQWSYNADQYFHAASTMKLAVLLGVFRQVDRGELSLDAPVHVRNRLRASSTRSRSCWTSGATPIPTCTVTSARRSPCASWPTG